MAKSQSTSLLAEQTTLHFQYGQKTLRSIPLQCSLWRRNPSQGSFGKESLNRSFGGYGPEVAILFNDSYKEQCVVTECFYIKFSSPISLVSRIETGLQRAQPVIITQTTPSSRTAQELYESVTRPLEGKSFQLQEFLQSEESDSGSVGTSQASSHEQDPKTRAELHNEHHQLGISIGNEQLVPKRKLWMLSAVTPALLGISAALVAVFLSISLAHILLAILSQRKLREKIQRHRYEHYGTGDYNDEESLPALQILE